MLRPALILALLAALALPAAASADEAFLGLLPEGQLARYTERSIPNVVLKDAAGLPAGERIVAITDTLALGRSGAIFRFDPRAVRVTPTAARVQLSGTQFSVIAVPGGARVLSETGMDVTAGLDSGVVTQGAGLKLLDGAPALGVYAGLPDGRVAGFDIARRAALLETAPGSGVVTETPLKSKYPGGLRIDSPYSFSLTDDGRGYLLYKIPAIRTDQSGRMFVNLATGEVGRQGGPFFFRRVIGAVTLGTVPDDKRAPEVSRVRVPRAISVRALRRNAAVRFSMRCSEGCNVIGRVLVAGRPTSFGTAGRDDAGTISMRLWRGRKRDLPLLNRSVGRRATVHFRISDPFLNRRTVTRHFRLTR